MMDSAFFVGRRAILDWLNSSFAMNVSKIEETASGAVACQILDAIYPGEVPMTRVRWDAKSAHEFIDNYKIIQQVFEKKGVEKHIEVEKLMRGKYQDNLENMQWFKSFFEKNYSGIPYDPIARRARGKGADAVVAFALDSSKRGSSNTQNTTDSVENTAPPSRSASKGSLPSQTVPQVTAPSQQVQQRIVSSSTVVPTLPVSSSTAKKSSSGGSVLPSQNTSSSSTRVSAVSPSISSGPALDAARAKIADLSGQVADLHLSVESLEKERDFYFGKLRDIEILLQSYSGPDPTTAAEITKILYATDEDFVAVDGS
jgi:RP/EB family microtubule-associated protein